MWNAGALRRAAGVELVYGGQTVRLDNVKRDVILAAGMSAFHIALSWTNLGPLAQGRSKPLRFSSCLASATLRSC